MVGVRYAEDVWLIPVPTLVVAVLPATDIPFIHNATRPVNIFSRDAQIILFPFQMVHTFANYLRDQNSCGVRVVLRSKVECCHVGIIPHPFLELVRKWGV